MAPSGSGKLTQAEKARAVRNQLLVEEGRRLVRVLNKRGIPSMVIKGPELSQRLYGSRGFRHHVDIDLLVQPKHARSAIDAIARDAYDCEIRNPDSPILRARCQNALRRRGVVPLTVELHWRLFFRHLPFPRRLELSSLWPRLEANGMEFGDHDLALYLCLHWVKEWEARDKLMLFATALAACMAFPWEAVVTEAEKDGTIRMLLLGSVMAHCHCGAKLPEWIIRRAEADTCVRRNGRDVARAFKDEAVMPSQWTQLWFAWRLLNRRIDRLRFLWYSLCVPTMAEYRAWPLASRWHWVYFFFRPPRLLWRHSVGLLFPNVAGNLRNGTRIAS